LDWFKLNEDLIATNLSENNGFEDPPVSDFL